MSSENCSSVWTPPVLSAVDDEGHDRLHDNVARVPTLITRDEPRSSIGFGVSVRMNDAREDHRTTGATNDGGGATARRESLTPRCSPPTFERRAESPSCGFSCFAVFSSRLYFHSNIPIRNFNGGQKA
jgi:hypothetical protein